jgi:hypothetical protein
MTCHQFSVPRCYDIGSLLGNDKIFKKHPWRTVGESTIKKEQGDEKSIDEPFSMG